MSRGSAVFDLSRPATAVLVLLGLGALTAFLFAAGSAYIRTVPMLFSLADPTPEDVFEAGKKHVRSRSLFRYSKYAKWIERTSAEIEAWSANKKRGDRLGLVLGRSSAAAAFDIETLEANDGRRIHWVRWFKAGHDFESFEVLAETLDQFSEMPEIILLALHLGWFTTPPYDRGDLPSRQWITDREVQPEGEKTWIAKTKEDFEDSYRTPAKNVIRNVGDKVRSSLMQRRNPSEGALPVPVERTRADWVNYLKSWGDPEKYSQDEFPAYAFTLFLKSFLERDIEVVVVLMPQSEELNILEAENAPRFFRELLDANIPSENLDVIDLREMLNESQFRDHIHPNIAGREAFSLRIARELASRLESQSAADER